MSTRVLYGNFKFRPPFPSLRPVTAAVEADFSSLDPGVWGSDRVRACSVCDGPVDREQFAALVPKVREFLRNRAFGETVDLADRTIIRAIATSVAQYVTVKTFAMVLRALVVEDLAPTLEHPGRPLSETEPFPFSRPTFQATKTVFNLVAADNEFERQFAQFLQDAYDVRSFAKLPRRFGFAIECHQPALLRAGLRGG